MASYEKYSDRVSSSSRVTKTMFELMVKPGGKHAHRDGAKSLDRQGWYHGLCSREDVEQLLTRPGCFLVRASESQGSVTIVLSLYTGDRKVHLTIAIGKEGQFYLKAAKGRRFATVYDLVHYYQTHRIKMKSASGASLFYRLQEGVLRPKWHVNSDWIKFDANKKPLGAGHFAQVFVGTFWPDGSKKGKGVAVAIKVLKASAGSGSAAEREAKQGLIREGKAMSFYQHPNVVQFYGTACDRPQQVILVMEYCPGGSLDKHLIAQKGEIAVAERVTFCLEAALGMRYLHSEGCLHRDLAARNCLISAEGIVKIADFGLSYKEGVIGAQKTGQVPIRWMAPETLVRDPFFSTQSDVWAFGILVYEIFNMGGVPFAREDNRKAATLIRHCRMPDMPSITPNEIKVLVGSIWISDCEDRPSFRVIVQKLREVRDAGYPMPPAKECSVNRLPNVSRVNVPDEADSPPWKQTTRTSNTGSSLTGSANETPSNYTPRTLLLGSTKSPGGTHPLMLSNFTPPTTPTGRHSRKKRKHR